MANVKWTPEQLTAIEARKGTLLVSAAAGSGKTAVLVERVIRRLTDPVEPCSVEELLIVTFTNAAAAQMKRKISAAISQKIAQAPQNGALRRQQMLLPLAKICTIDSFCINLVRDNFQSLGVSPDFAVLDPGRLSILRNDALNTVLEKLYAAPPEGFAQLIGLVCDSRDDSALSSAIIKLYDISQAYPFPEKWLDSVAESYLDRRDISETPWGTELYSYLDKMLQSAISYISKAIDVSLGDDVLKGKYTPVLEGDIEALSELKAQLPSLKFDEAAEKFASFKFAALGRVPKGYESEEKEIITSIRNEVKKDVFKKGADSVFVTTQQEHIEDSQALSAPVGCLVEAVKAFAAEFGRLKREENGADFNDTLHLAISLLASTDESGNIVPSQTARELSDGFAEILIDEYQDVNEAQDIVFNLISKNGSNLFMVGDVKQSIYGFRRAMPEIFLEKRNRFPLYTDGNYPATVVLGKNFRSRSGVTENVNFAFSRIMTEGIGGLGYGEADKLHYNEGGYPPHTEPDAELHYIVGEESSDERNEKEVAYIADYIEQNCGKLLVNDGGVLRKAGYGDFCVLFRSIKGEGAMLADELEKRSIPVSCDSAGGFFEAPEIRFMLSLLRILDNPLDDISLLAVMLSPVFGFTPDELSEIRAAQRKGTLYHAAVFAAENGDEKSSSFLAGLDSLRSMASTVTVAELVRRLLDETGYYSVVSAMKDAGLRRLNLSLLVDYASRYESTGRTGLSGFLRYIDRAEKSGAETPGAVNAPEGADVVRIMTIHKSKGLEFPVVILGGVSRKFNPETLNANMLISRFCGVGIKSAQGGGFVRCNTVIRAAARAELLNSERAEELRVLYVALTRAKEKFVVVSSVKENESYLKRAALNDGETVEPFAVLRASCPGEIIASAFITHPCAGELRKLSGAYNTPVKPFEAKLKVVIGTGEAAERIPEDPEEVFTDVAEKLEEIRKRTEYVYPFACLDSAAAKRVASDFSANEEDLSFFASERPAFMSKKELTPAERGSATHKFMQFADFDAAKADLEKEAAVLCEKGYLGETEAKAVELSKLKAFFESELFGRVSAAEELYREYSFTCALRADEAYLSLTGEAACETVVVDGVADLAFVENGELVIVDYKTDRAVSAQELAERYKGQLAVYRRCLSKALEIKVKQTLIYSFSLGKTVEIPED